MNLVFRIVFGIVVGVIFVSITFSTFFTQKQYATLLDLEIEKSQKLSASGSTYYNYVSKFESLYSNSQLEIESNIEQANIPIFEEGKYLSSLRKLGVSYDFTGTGYVISQKGIGELYIDSMTKQGKVFVYAKNTPAEISLLSEDNTQEFTTIYLAPGMYLEFRTGIGKNLNNADRLRISTVNKLGYLGDIDQGDIDSTIQIYFTSADNIYHEAIEHISSIDRKKRSYITNFIGSEIPQVSGYNYIQRYLHLFVNTEKKKVFYKNMVLAGYTSLIESKKIDSSLITQVKKDEQKLKNIDTESYNELMSLRGDIVSAVYSMQSSSFIPTKLMFSELISGDIEESEWLYPLYSYSLFSGDNLNDESSQLITKSFFDSFSGYMENYTETQTPYDYFLYFLERRLIYLLSGNISEESIGSTLEVLSNYVKISNTAQYSEKNQKITQIYSINQVLESLDSFLRNTFFLTQRDSNNLLVLQNNISLGGLKLTELQTEINSLYSIYEKNSSLLSPSSSRDIRIMRDLTEIEKNITEYLSAIGNYAQYKDIYDISKSTILNVDVLTNGQSGLTQQKGKEYLAQFVGISQQGFSIEVIDESYYQVKDLIIGGRRFNFDIYPYSGSRLKNISIDGEQKTTQYTLDNIKDDWDERYKTAAIEDRDEYDFARFFILTFLTSQEREVIIFDKESKQQESTAEIVFKRDILLGNKGEFNTIKNFLNIAYDDITLLQQGNSYNIFLRDVDIDIDDSGLEKRKKISGKLQSQYVLNDTTHNFKNVEFAIENEKKAANNTLQYEFGGTYISILGDIYILELEQVLRDIVKNTEVYVSLYNLIQPYLQSDVSIEFTPSNMKTRFKFDSGEKTFTIILQNSEITGMYEGTAKLATSPISLQEIKSYLE